MVTVERIEIFQWLSHLGCKAASAYMKHFHVFFWAAILFVSSSNVPWNLIVLFLICQNAFHASVVTCCPAPEWHLCGLMDLRLASLSNSLQDFKYKCTKYKNTYKSKTQIQIWVARVHSDGDQIGISLKFSVGAFFFEDDDGDDWSQIGICPPSSLSDLKFYFGSLLYCIPPQTGAGYLRIFRWVIISDSLLVQNNEETRPQHFAVTKIFSRDP